MEITAKKLESINPVQTWVEVAIVLCVGIYYACQYTGIS